MSEPTDDGNPATTDPEPTQNPASTPPAPAKRTLESSLADLDDETRKFVLGEVTSARSEARNLRARVQEAEPIVAQFRALEEASQSAEERAQAQIKAAEERARNADRRIATAELRAALTGVVPDAAAFVEDLNVDRFIRDGDVDTEAIQALRQKYAAYAPQQQPTGPRPNRGQGGSAAGTPSVADQIAEAEKAGDHRRAIALKSQQLLDLRTQQQTQ